jgi:hydrogenase maturation protease
MRAAIIAIGNIYRRDDGAAHHCAELLGDLPGVLVHDCLQPTPELAVEIASSERVYFVDASVEAGDVRLTALNATPPASRAPGHVVLPADVVELARELFGFRGNAWLCHIPATDFSDGEGLTPETKNNALRAAELLRNALSH